MNAATTLPRTPLVISAGNLTAGPIEATFRDGDRESLLHNYLVLVRRLRGQLSEQTITLRNADVAALAEHLDASQETVLGDLLDRMGATRVQRKAVLAMFAVGALSIVATGSVALELSSGDALAPTSTDTPPAAVEDARTGDVTGPTATDEAPETAVESPAVAGESVVATTGAVPPPELALALGGDDWEYTLSLRRLAHALSTQPP